MDASEFDKLTSAAEIDELHDRLRRLRRNLDRQAGAARVLAQRGKQLQREVADLRHYIELHQQVVGLLTGIGEDRQADAQAKIETLVSQGLKTIFGLDLTFHLVPAVRAKTPVVDFVVRSTLPDGTTVDTDVLDARGGGLAATVGFLLRLVVLLLSRERLDPVLILDETFAHLSREYEPRLAEFLREMVDQIPDLQVIIVTHSDAYHDLADVRYRFTLDHGVTNVAPA